MNGLLQSFRNLGADAPGWRSRWSWPARWRRSSSSSPRASRRRRWGCSTAISTSRTAARSSRSSRRMNVPYQLRARRRADPGAGRPGGAAAHGDGRAGPAAWRLGRLRDLRQDRQLRHARSFVAEHQPGARARGRARAHHLVDQPRFSRRASISCCRSASCSRATRQEASASIVLKLRGAERLEQGPGRRDPASRRRGGAEPRTRTASRSSTATAICWRAATAMRADAAHRRPTPRRCASITRTASRAASRKCSSARSAPARRASMSTPRWISTASPRIPRATIPTARWCARPRPSTRSTTAATAPATSRSRSPTTCPNGQTAGQRRRQRQPHQERAQRGDHQLRDHQDRQQPGARAGDGEAPLGRGAGRRHLRRAAPTARRNYSRARPRR